MSLAKKILVLTGVLAVGLSTVFFLPETPPMRDTRLARHLPETFGEWRGYDVQVGERELAILAKDTGFERKSYKQRYDSSAQPVEVSVVFSGKDLNNSIHRPETCLKTQGWEFVRLRYITLPDAANGAPLPVKEMLCKRMRLNEDGEPMMSPNGTPSEDWQLLYYTFIGHTTITPGHYSRTFADIRDRVLGGYDQTWAYATFSTPIMGKYSEQGFTLGGTRPLNEEETGQYLADFIGNLTPKVLSDSTGSSSDSTARKE